MTYAHIWQVRAPLDAYDAVWAEVRRAHGEAPPDGLILHLAAPTEDGFEILEIWRTAEHSARFAGQVLAPAVSRALGELPAGDRRVLPIHRVIAPARDGDVPPMRP